MPTVALLRTIDFLAHVEDSILQKLARRVRRRTYKPNVALFHAGDPGLILYMVVSGWVRIERVTASGQKFVIGKRGPGTQMGELALIDGAARMADAVTDTECELLTLDREAFLECINASPTAALAIMSSLAQLVRSAGASLESFRSRDTLGRLAEVLLQYCENVGVDIGNGEIQINVRLTHQSLAEEVGSARETVSRSLGMMIETGVLRKTGQKFIVSKPDRLQHMVDG